MDLEAITAASRRRSNLVAVSATAALMGSFVLFNGGAPDHAEAVRQKAAFMAIMHGLFYFVSVSILRGMARRGVENAALALACYQDPRRISHRDLAVAWSCLLIAARYLI